jgi:nitrate/nitrite transporter NarK
LRAISIGGFFLGELGGRRFGVVLAASAAYFVFSLSYQLVAAMGLEVSNGLGLDGTQLMALATACMLGFSIGPVFGGYLDGRVGSRANTAFWLTIQAVASLAFVPLHESYCAILCLRFVQGVAGGMLVPSVLGTVNAWFSRVGAAVASGVTVGVMGVGFTAAHAASAALMDAGLAWYMVVAACTCGAAAVALACVAPGLACFEETHPGFARYDQMVGTHATGSYASCDDGRPSTMRGFVASGTFWFMALYCLIKSAFTAGIPAIFPQYLVDEFGLTSFEVSSVTGGAYMASVVGAPLGGLLSGYIFAGRRWQTMALGACVTCATTAAIPLCADLGALRVLLFLCYGGTALGTGAFWALTTEVVSPSLAPKANGLLTSVANVGGTAVPFALVVVSSFQGSLGTCFMAFAALAVLQAVCAWAIRR